MRRSLFILTTILPFFLYAQSIQTSAHDFSSAAWNIDGEICIVCHTDHNGNVAVDAAPLWNHTVPQTQYIPYTSATFDAKAGQPTGTSKICLSCHDGSVALDSFGGKTGNSYLTGSANLGTDLSNDHPVSFVYDPGLSLKDGGLADPLSDASGLGSSIDNDLLFRHRLECTSCHDVHNKQGNPGLLVINNTKSRLCLTCHEK